MIPESSLLMMLFPNNYTRLGTSFVPSTTLGDFTAYLPEITITRYN